jgi:ribonucleoside-triphosphate reductase
MTPELTTDLIRLFLNDEIPASDLPDPVWGPIGKAVYERSYSRNIVEADGSVSPGWIWKVPEGRTSEVWAETARRVVLGNLAYAPTESALPWEAEGLFRMIFEMKILPAGRHLWMTGVPGAALKNCHRAGWSNDVTDHFRFMATQLFQGGGVGSNYSAVYRQRGEKMAGRVKVSITCDPSHKDYTAVRIAAGELWWEEPYGVETFQVEDTREGWVAAWLRLIRLAHESGTHSVSFDLSDVRPQGAPLRSFGGQASGPAPLAGSLVSIAQALSEADLGRHLSAIEAMKIDHYMASAIVAGGTRRSARMSQLNWDDPEILEFISHKRNDPMASWSTNISVVLDDAFHQAVQRSDEVALNILDEIAIGMATDGEPGIYNLALAKVGELRDVAATNPCGEAVLEEHYDPETGTGSASGESCNLGSVDLDAFGTSYVEVRIAFMLLTRFLYRATLAPIYDDHQAEIEYRNRRLGVGLMGLQGWVAAHGLKLTELPHCPELLGELTEFRATCRFAADEIADQLGLPRPIKVTAVAPTGTIDQLRGTTSGIHPVYARYFVRRVQYSDHDPNLDAMIAKGYHVEDSVYADSTKVVSIPVRDIILDRHPESLIQQADEVTVDAFLAIQGAVQGSFCGGTDGQAISATANIPADLADVQSLSETLRKHLPTLKGATVFPAISRPQTPITAISAGEWAEMSLALMETVTAGDSNDGVCAGGACPIR